MVVLDKPVQTIARGILNAIPKATVNPNTKDFNIENNIALIHIFSRGCSNIFKKYGFVE
jgi:hypothetical protein